MVGWCNIFKVGPQAIQGISVDVVDFVAGRWMHNLDVEADKVGFACDSNPSANVDNVGGLNEPPVMAESPFENIMVNKRKMAVADRQ